MKPLAASAASLNLSWIGMPYSLRYGALARCVGAINGRRHTGPPRRLARL